MNPLANPSLILTLCIASFASNLSSAAQSPTLDASVAASRGATTMSASILMTWRSGGITKQVHGTIQLQKPNLGRIALEGEYPEILLLSDGHTRYLAPNKATYETSSMDPSGIAIDSPWWGLPFRFFFTQSLNPFGARPDATAAYADDPAEESGLRGVSIRGTSPMGGYTEKAHFNLSGDLVESDVLFGDGPGAAFFKANLTDIRHHAIPARTFTFKPEPGQVASTSSDTMLAIGAQAPAFTLPTPRGASLNLSNTLRGKKAVLLNFWYYNCAPCRIEFPEFEKLYRQFAPQGLTIIAINKGDPTQTVSNYVKRAGLTFPVVLGGDASKGSIFDRYKVTESFPGSYLIDAHGKIVYRGTGEDIAGLKQALNKLGFQ